MIRLTHGTTAVDVDATAGGRLAGWRVDGRELLVTSGPDPMRWGCYPMVPWAGRLRDGRFSAAGVDVVMAPPDEQVHVLHGLGYRLPWEVLALSDRQAVLGLDLGGRPAQVAGWPFGGQVEATVTAGADEVSLRIAVTAEGGPLPLVVGWHPWFRRTLDGVEGEVSAPAEAMYLRGPDHLPTGEVIGVTPGPWDDCMLRPSAPPQVRWPGVGAVVVDGDADHLVVFDAGPDGICVEPQTGPPDAFNIGGHRVLDPGETQSLDVVLRWRAG